MRLILMSSPFAVGPCGEKSGGLRSTEDIPESTSATLALAPHARENPAASHASQKTPPEYIGGTLGGVTMF